MKLKLLEILSPEEIELIHASTLELLSKIGVKIDSQETRELLEKRGAILDNNSSFVYFPEQLVMETLKTVPSSFKLYGADGTFNFEVNTTTTQFATIGTPVIINDSTKKKGVRKTVLADTINQIKIVDSLEHVMASHVDVWPNDVPFTALHAHVVYQWAKHSTKPYGLGVYGRVASQDVMDMVSLIVGGDEELINHPRLIGFYNTTSPLEHPKIMINGLEIFAKYKQPIIIAPEALAGSTAPVTLAGLLTQTNAEVLSGIVLSQLFNPGAPVFYGTVSNLTDMRSGNSAMGSVETGLITTGMAQLARFYNIPSRGPGAVTDSKTFDLQNGFERMQTLMYAAHSGINYITCAGTYEATLAESFELLVIDNELIGMIKRARDGIRVTKDTIALDVIKKVATSTKKGATFLAQKHTMKNLKKELFIPTMVDRNRRNSWRKKGSKTIMDTAKEKVAQILETHIDPTISDELDAQLLAFIRKIEARTLEYYKEKEGLTVDSVNITGTDINVEMDKK